MSVQAGAFKITCYMTAELFEIFSQAHQSEILISIKSRIQYPPTLSFLLFMS